MGPANVHMSDSLWRHLVQPLPSLYITITLPQARWDVPETHISVLLLLNEVKSVCTYGLSV